MTDRPDGAAFVTGIAEDGLIALDCGHERPALAEYESLVAGKKTLKRPVRRRV